MSTRAAGVLLALVTATISGFAVFLNGYAVKRFDDATVYTTAKNGVAGLLLVLVALPLLISSGRAGRVASRPRSGLQWKKQRMQRRRRFNQISEWLGLAGRAPQ